MTGKCFKANQLSERTIEKTKQAMSKTCQLLEELIHTEIDEGKIYVDPIYQFQSGVAVLLAEYVKLVEEEKHANHHH